jgi:hypothetical protein
MPQLLCNNSQSIADHMVRLWVYINTTVAMPA